MRLTQLSYLVNGVKKPVNSEVHIHLYMQLFNDCSTTVIFSKHNLLFSCITRNIGEKMWRATEQHLQFRARVMIELFLNVIFILYSIHLFYILYLDNWLINVKRYHVICRSSSENMSAYIMQSCAKVFHHHGM